MYVEILNPEESVALFKYWGIASCICYNTPEKFAEKVGRSCLETEHYSGSRGRYIMFKIGGVPRALVDQMVRHEVGVFKNVQSQRYVNMTEADYHTPGLLEVEGFEEVRELYDDTMLLIKEAYGGIVDLLKEKGIVGEKANEIARGVIGMNYNSELVIGFTVEALINLCHKRMCVCSQEHIRKLVLEMRAQVVDLLPELRTKLVPKCKYLLWCPESEKRSCGAFPQRGVVEEMVNQWKKQK